MQQLDILYKRDSKGNSRQWEVWTDGDKVVVQHGMTGGKLQLKTTVSKPKNIGKVNETNGAQQAVSEAISKWNKQVEREDYHQDIDKAGLQLRPTLALDYLKVPHRVDWNKTIIQPKLDGLRLTSGKRHAVVDSFESMTRKGETYQVPHLDKHSRNLLLLLREENEVHALDGEAYLHGLPLQKIISYAKKYQKGLTETLEYHCFDLIMDGTFEDRYAILQRGIIEYNARVSDSPFELVECVEVDNEFDAKEYQGKWMEMGYEGVIIRHTDGLYKHGRSPDLFKFKQFMDDECKIMKMWTDLNGNAMLTVRQKNGKACDVTPKRTHDFRKQMLLEEDKWIGEWINCKFQGYTPDEVMQFPVGLLLRECDEEGNPLT